MDNLMNNLHFYTSRKRPKVHPVTSARGCQCFTQISGEASSKVILMPELRFRYDDWIKRISWSRRPSAGMKYCYSCYVFQMESDKKKEPRS